MLVPTLVMMPPWCSLPIKNIYNEAILKTESIYIAILLLPRCSIMACTGPPLHCHAECHVALSTSLSTGPHAADRKVIECNLQVSYSFPFVSKTHWMW